MTTAIFETATEFAMTTYEVIGTVCQAITWINSKFAAITTVAVALYAGFVVVSMLFGVSDAVEHAKNTMQIASAVRGN